MKVKLRHDERILYNIYISFVTGAGEETPQLLPVPYNDNLSYHLRG